MSSVDIEQHKVCPRCRIDKPISNFKSKNTINVYCLPVCQREYQKEYRAKNRAKLVAQDKEYYWKTKGTKKKWNGDKEKKSAYQKKWAIAKYRANIEQSRKIQREYRKSRRKTDVNFHLADVLRCRLRAALKGKAKSGSSVKNLGCSLDDLKKHLENRFAEGMTWENWGIHGWHVDHIKPISSFDLSDQEQLLAAVHYTNLQPLWAEDNFKKSDKY